MNNHNDGERPLRILHIEDSPRDAEIIRERLIAAGFFIQLDWAANEQEFTSFLQGGGYDLALADYELPVFDAPAALELTKSLCPGVPFICVSGAIGEDKAVELLKQGATDYIPKNRLDKLPLAMQRALDEAKERKARVNAEEALLNERNLIANIMETSPVGITTVDSMGRITFANSKAIAILGLSKDEIAQKTYNAPAWNISDIDGSPFPEEKLPFTLVMSTGKAVFDVQHAIQWPEGKRILLSINGAPMIDANGQVTGMVASIEDITSRKQTEENYRTLFREMIDGFALHEIICDEEGRPIDYRFLVVNPAFERMTGLKAEELVGRTVLEVLPKTERHWIESYGQVALTGEPVLFENYAVELEKHFQVTSFQSAPNQFACIFADITDRKLAEAEKANLEKQLFQSQKMEAIGTLAGGVAHDFNNILAAIIGYTEMATEESQKEIQSRYLQETLKGAERAKNLVKQILTFSRQDGHEKKPLDIKLLLKEAIKFLRASIPATIEIRQRLTDESCNILADPTQMHQVIMNLCTNAGHAMKQTGGVLTMELSTIELSPGEISRHSDLKPGPYVKLTVSDTGHGIDHALQLRIFDPFFTTKSKEEGTGLGLSVVYGIVKSHNGVVTVYSEPGKGASFNVYLPMIIHEEITKRSVSSAVTGGTERILFVDDEPALVDIGISMLSALGYQVTGVTSSMEALNLFRAAPDRFDLVITDMTLPKLTGIDLSREMIQIRPEIPVILCSGIRDSETEGQVKSLGIRAYCIKPLTRRDLSRVIRETLDER